MADSGTQIEPNRPAAQLAFHGELGALARGGPVVLYPVERRASIKDVAEALGVPHTEVHALEVDGRAAGFGHLLEPGQKVDVRPGIPPVDTAAATALRPGLDEMRFLVDENVAKLAMLLRLIGQDASYTRALPDADLARRADKENRIVLSKDTALLKRSLVRWGRLVRAARPLDQIVEVMGFFGLDLPERAAFTRCLRCNAPLNPVDKADVMDRLLPKTKKYYHSFNICPECERIYWQGSHHDRMRELLRELGDRAPNRPAPASI